MQLGLDALTVAQRAELVEIYSEEAVADLEAEQLFAFHRVGITEDGAWNYFVGGD